MTQIFSNYYLDDIHLQKFAASEKIGKLLTFASKKTNK